MKETSQCPKCHTGIMKPGFALENTWVNGSGRQPIGDQTITQTGPAQQIECLKCSNCGHSIRSLKVFVREGIFDGLNEFDKGLPDTKYLINSLT